MLKIKHKVIIASMLGIAASGCAYGPQLARTENILTEESRRLTTACPALFTPQITFVMN